MTGVPALVSDWVIGITSAGKDGIAIGRTRPGGRGSARSATSELHRGRLVALLDDGRDHRVEQTPALVALQVRPSSLRRARTCSTGAAKWCAPPGARHILASSGDPAARSQLEEVLALDPRNAGTTYMSAAHLLHAYRYPEVLATSKPGFTAADLLDGDAGTLYLTASSRHQKMLAPILVALVSSVIDAAIERSRADGAPLDPLLRVLLDETANCAPLQTLPAHLAAHGIRIATVWQSIAQLRDRYGDAKDAILGASTCKVFLGPITDDTTRKEVVELLGRQAVEVDDDHSTLGPLASAQDLQQLQRWRAPIVAGSLPPTVVRYEPYWRIREFG